jgi:hypothetical protein
LAAGFGTANIISINVGEATKSGSIANTRKEVLMNRMLLVLAWLGTVLVVFVTQMFLPDTREGRTLAFIVCFVALFPLARTLWFVNMPVWRYWAGLAGRSRH